MLGPLRSLLLPLLRRDPAEIARRAAPFAIRTEKGRQLVAQLGEAFLNGYNAMLTLDSSAGVAAEGARVAPHFRPFFFEGAAMGFLPRGYYARGFGPARAERELLAMSPDYLYLYYVGLGFWFGMRHPRRPAALQSLAEHLDRRYFPLCYDGYGFKVGFFDYPRRPSAVMRLARAPAEHAAAIHQGFGRALFFVFMDDEAGFQHVRSGLAPERRPDLEIGRSLALGFTGIDRPETLVHHLSTAPSEADRAARLTGLTWALTAREMNDHAYFDACLASAHAEWRSFFRTLPRLCRDAFAASNSYLDWQEKTRAGATAAYDAFPPKAGSEASRGSGGGC